MSEETEKIDEIADLDNAEVVEDTPDFMEAEEDAMNPTHPNWTNYVLSQMQPDEKSNNSPTTDGLRRVTERLIGRIIVSRTDVLDVPRKENDCRATVRVSLTIDVLPELGGGLLEVDGVADVYWGNTDKPYRNFPTATAETRAEGRALRRALRLSKVACAEEMGTVVDHDFEAEERPEGAITETQERYIDVMCKRLDVDLKKTLALLYPQVGTIRNLKYSDFEHLQASLAAYQQDTASIPGDIKGYKDGWRSSDDVPF